MNYALLPRGDVVEVKEDLSEYPRRFSRLPRWRIVSRSPSTALVLLGAGCLFLLGYVMTLHSSLNLNRPSNTRAFRPQLDFIQEDGIQTPPLQEATIARWPEDYPLAASYLQKNSIVPSTEDPWPEKPYIADIWCNSLALTRMRG